LEWGEFGKQESIVSKTPLGGRKSLRGMCTCLHVQYVQQRGEKPFLKCQIWIDQGHPDWSGADGDKLAIYAKSLCHFEIS
jgi:hypothetical protein